MENTPSVPTPSAEISAASSVESSVLASVEINNPTNETTSTGPIAEKALETNVLDNPQATTASAMEELANGGAFDLRAEYSEILNNHPKDDFTEGGATVLPDVQEATVPQSASGEPTPSEKSSIEQQTDAVSSEAAQKEHATNTTDAIISNSQLKDTGLSLQDQNRITVRFTNEELSNPQVMDAIKAKAANGGFQNKADADAFEAQVRASLQNSTPENGTTNANTSESSPQSKEGVIEGEFKELKDDESHDASEITIDKDASTRESIVNALTGIQATNQEFLNYINNMSPDEFTMWVKGQEMLNKEKAQKEGSNIGQENSSQKKNEDYIEGEVKNVKDDEPHDDTETIIKQKSQAEVNTEEQNRINAEREAARKAARETLNRMFDENPDLAIVFANLTEGNWRQVGTEIKQIETKLLNSPEGQKKKLPKWLEAIRFLAVLAISLMVGNADKIGNKS